MSEKYYLTAAIPYVNAIPHIGHALEFVQADVVSRFKRLIGYRTLFVCGSDENGLKIVQAAEKENITPQQLTDKNTQVFKDLINLLSVSIDVWRRGSDTKFHWPGTHKLWERCWQNGDIYKKMYGGYYCIGCEDFYTKKDLVEGKCPEHLKEPEWIEEENYFFKLSKYQGEIEKLITSNELLIIPETRRNEALSFIHSGLEDFSISRSKIRAKGWGIPVPKDNSQVIYTWFDALNVYQTAIGLGYDEKLWKDWWPADVHIIGKGILRFHAIYWIGMLLSAKFPLPKSLFVHGYITMEGQKMSKSLGNIIDPFSLIKKYGTDPVRYYLLREIPSYGDGDFSESRFKEVYNADLANGLGNLISRVAKLCEQTAFVNQYQNSFCFLERVRENKSFEKLTEEFRFNEALGSIWSIISDLDKYIDQNHPWTLKKETLRKVLEHLVSEILTISTFLSPFLPETAAIITKQFTKPKIKSRGPLFPRLS